MTTNQAQKRIYGFFRRQTLPEELSRKLSKELLPKATIVPWHKVTMAAQFDFVMPYKLTVLAIATRNLL